MKKTLQQKLKAAAIHLSLSTVILSSFLLYVFFIWYPSPYAEISGLGYIVTVLVGVDLVLGPLLTFILYKKNKPHLLFDLSVIVLIQFAALSYGMYAVYKKHPSYVVFAVDRFELIAAKDVDPTQARREEFKVSELWFPKHVFAKIPEDREEHNQLLFDVVLGGQLGVQWRPQYYEPLEDHLQTMLNAAMDAGQLFNSKNRKNRLNAFLHKHGGAVSDYAFFPLVGKEKDVVMAVRSDTGELTGAIDVYPWGKS